MDCGDKYFLLDTIHNLNKIQYIENILSFVGNVAEYTRQNLFSQNITLKLFRQRFLLYF